MVLMVQPRHTLPAGEVRYLWVGTPMKQERQAGP